MYIVAHVTDIIEVTTERRKIMKEFKIENHEPSILPEGKKWKLVWSDEFDGDKLDESKWSYRTDFWGADFEAYTDKGVSLDGKGNVVFRPVVENGTVRSAQLQTGGNSFDKLDFQGSIKNRMEKSVGDNPWGQIELWPLRELEKPKFMHRFGYYEARVKLQSKNFWWSAFWLQSPSIGAAYEPKYCGIENDIMEHFNGNEITSGNIYGGYGKQFKETARIHYDAENTDEFHRFGLEWSKYGYVFYFDGKETARSNSPVSEVEQFILLSTEVQGYRSGKPLTEYTEEMLNDRFICDYVRVFDEVE